MYKWIGLVILLIVLLLAIGFFFFNGKKMGTTYEGILPGADCAGLKTELTVFEDGSFFLKETYLATRDGDKTFTSSGKWQKRASKGRAIIQLNYDKPKEVYNFMVKDADHLVVIDRQMRQIDAPINLTLTRKK
jgi:copper homeostasis protein (lipoprotein)